MPEDKGGWGGGGVSKNHVEVKGGGQQKLSMAYFTLHQPPLPTNNDQSLSTVLAMFLN